MMAQTVDVGQLIPNGQDSLAIVDCQWSDSVGTPTCSRAAGGREHLMARGGGKPKSWPKSCAAGSGMLVLVAGCQDSASQPGRESKGSRNERWQM